MRIKQTESFKVQPANILIVLFSRQRLFFLVIQRQCRLERTGYLHVLYLWINVLGVKPNETLNLFNSNKRIFPAYPVKPDNLFILYATERFSNEI